MRDNIPNVVHTNILLNNIRELQIPSISLLPTKLSFLSTMLLEL